MWYSIKEKTPRCWEEGLWDGKKSDQFIVELTDGQYVIAVCYEGFIDGHNFRDFYYDLQEYTLDEKEIKRWMYIPD